MSPAPAPAPFVNLGVVPLTEPPSVRWAAGSAVVDLGSGIEIFTASAEQAAALEAAFARARRMHAEGGQS